MSGKLRKPNAQRAASKEASANGSERDSPRQPRRFHLLRADLQHRRRQVESSYPGLGETTCRRDREVRRAGGEVKDVKNGASAI